MAAALVRFVLRFTEHTASDHRASLGALEEIRECTGFAVAIQSGFHGRPARVFGSPLDLASFYHVGWCLGCAWLSCLVAVVWSNGADQEHGVFARALCDGG